MLNYIYVGLGAAIGGTSRIHACKILALSNDMPLIIEIVDKIERIENFLPKLNEIFEEANCGGLVTIEKAEVIKYITQKSLKASLFLI